MRLVLLLGLSFALGFAGSMGMPAVMVALGEHGQRLGRTYWKIALSSVGRPAITVNDVGDLLLKKRSYNDDLQREEVSVGGISRKIEDPQDRLHHFYGVPFGFVDEIFGFVFDLRDADAGREAWTHFDDATFVAAEQSTRGYFERVRGFFELPKGTRAVALSPVRHLVGGGSDAAAAERIIEFYRKSQEPRSKTTATMQMLVPFGGFILVVLVGWFVYSQTGGGGGGGGGSSTDVGALLLLAAPTAMFRRIPKRVLAFTLIMGIVGLLSQVGLLLVVPPTMLLMLDVAFIAGFLFLPGTAYLLGRSLGPFGVAFAKLYMIFALLPFDKPVIHQTEADEYELVDASELDSDTVEDIAWYRFAKSWIGLAYSNSEDAWPGETTTMSPTRVGALAETLATDGGNRVSTNVPPGYAPSSQLSFGGHEAFVPVDPDEGNVHVQTHHALAWFRDVCRGETIRRAHEYGKQKYGGGERPLGDRMVLLATFGMMVLGVVIDYIAFFS